MGGAFSRRAILEWPEFSADRYVGRPIQGTNLGGAIGWLLHVSLGLSRRTPTAADAHRYAHPSSSDSDDIRHASEVARTRI